MKLHYVPQRSGTLAKPFEWSRSFLGRRPQRASRVERGRDCRARRRTDATHDAADVNAELVELAAVNEFTDEIERGYCTALKSDERLAMTGVLKVEDIDGGFDLAPTFGVFEVIAEGALLKVEPV
ncbi:MAG: hypothetical protein ACRDJT_09415 [Actinomycetota bacterium]